MIEKEHQSHLLGTMYGQKVYHRFGNCSALFDFQKNQTNCGSKAADCRNDMVYKLMYHIDNIKFYSHYFFIFFHLAL